MDLAFLKKYNALPKELRDKVNNPAVVSNIEKIELKYGLSLAEIVMKVLTKDIPLAGLGNFLASAKKIDQAKSEIITSELKADVFAGVMDYLEIPLIRGTKGVKIDGPKEPPAPPLSGGQKKTQEKQVEKYEDHHPAFAKASAGKPVDKNKAIKTIEDLEKRVEEDIDHEKVLEAQAKTRVSGFFFHPEDEQEVAAAAKGKIDFAPEEQPTDPDALAEKIIKEVQLNFSSGFLVDRFKQVLKTYVRGVRDVVDTKVALKKSFDAGGLAMDEESASKVIMIAGKYKMSAGKSGMQAPKKIAVPEDAVATAGQKAENKPIGIGLRDVPYDLSGMTKKESPAQTQSSPTEDLSNRINVRMVTDPGSKKKMDDIKFVPVSGSRPEVRISGPIDELRMMDTVTFRRLGQQDPFRAASRIKEMISLLDEDDYNKKVEGIKAWRMSPMNKLYLEIGEQSILQGKPIDVVTAEMKFSGKEVLSNLEFEAIMDLNKELRF